MSAPASLHCTLDLFLVPSTFPDCSLRHRETTQTGLAAPKHPEPMVNLIHIAATPAIIIGRVSAAHGESRPLVLAELVWDRRSRVTSQKQGNQGHSAQHVGYRSYIEARDRGRIVEFEQLSILHRPMDGQVQSLKGAEEDQLEQQVIWSYFV